MKLETTPAKRCALRDQLEAANAEGFFSDSLMEVWEALFRDIDTLLAEVERLSAERRPFSDGLAQKVIDEQVKTIDRLTAKLAAESSAPPLPAEVEEVRGKLEARVTIIEAFVREINASPGGEHEKLANELREAASLLSRWPGVMVT